MREDRATGSEQRGPGRPAQGARVSASGGRGASGQFQMLGVGCGVGKEAGGLHHIVKDNR